MAPNEDSPPALYSTYVGHDLKYNADFEDSLMHHVLDPSANPPNDNAIRIIPEDSAEVPSNTTARAGMIDPASLPHVTEDELPLSLDDSRRKFTSPLPGVNLTHPGGYLEGGPGLDPEMDTFPDDFLANHPRITTGVELRGAVEREVEASRELLRERLSARQRAKERNEQIEKELKTLTDQHNMELRIQERMAEDVRKKKEERERRRREREGG